jgi:GxxExxY protein
MKNTLSTVEPLNQLTSLILDAAISVHKEMGPGLLETVYHHCLIKELMNRDLQVKTMVPVPLVYKGDSLNKDFILDLLIEDEIIVELKAIEGVLPVHEAQILSYLRLTNKRIGLLINFNVPRLITGFKRFVNKL